MGIYVCFACVCEGCLCNGYLYEGSVCEEDKLSSRAPECAIKVVAHTRICVCIFVYIFIVCTYVLCVFV